MIIASLRYDDENGDENVGCNVLDIPLSFSASVIIDLRFKNIRGQNVNKSERAIGKIRMLKLKKVRESLLLAHCQDIIDTEEFCVLYDINTLKNPDLPYFLYEKFDLESWEEDE